MVENPKKIPKTIEMRKCTRTEETQNTSNVTKRLSNKQATEIFRYFDASIKLSR